MRLIDADALKKELISDYAYAAATMVDETPTVDAVPVVRCKDCKHYNIFRLLCTHNNFNGYINHDGFCSFGEKKQTFRWNRSGVFAECRSCGEIYSLCGENENKHFNFCPCCGADMRGETE